MSAELSFRKKAPRKLFYKIGEVCDICGIEAHVLRYWETEFPSLSPGKNRAGQRIYRPQDVQLVQTIQSLLHEEGYTIAGARKKLDSESTEEGLPLFTAPRAAQRKLSLGIIRRDLLEILELTKNNPES